MATNPDVTQAARNTMRANRGRDTGPELALRSLLHARGLRFRVNHPLPFDARRRADITFTRVGLYVFVDGCFWHGCPEHFVVPKTRRKFWTDKIGATKARDIETQSRLEDLGAFVTRIWEHQEAIAAAELVATLHRALADRIAGPFGHQSSKR